MGGEERREHMGGGKGRGGKHRGVKGRERVAEVKRGRGGMGGEQRGEESGEGEGIIEESGSRGEEEGTREGEGRFNIARHMHRHLWQQQQIGLLSLLVVGKHTQPNV